MTSLGLADKLVTYLKKQIAPLPSDFYDSMKYTCTGNNLTHPITWGLLARFVWQEIKSVDYVGIDVHQNAGHGKKFQPDVVAFKCDLTKPIPLLFIDCESPNSSDWRPIYKDIVPYLAWAKKEKCDAPYIVITMLPDKPVKKFSSWDCTSKAQYRKLKRSPYQFWYHRYRKQFERLEAKLANVAVININGKQVKREFPPQ